MTEIFNYPVGSQNGFTVAPVITKARIKATFDMLNACFSSLRSLRESPEQACWLTSVCVVRHNSK